MYDIVYWTSSWNAAKNVENASEVVNQEGYHMAIKNIEVSLLELVRTFRELPTGFSEN